MSWRAFFAHHAESYDQEPFAQATETELDFLEEELNLPQEAHILDAGCGTGRHSVGLAKRGYRVTGVDLSSDMLRLARERAKQADVVVDFVQSDTKEYTSEQKHDGAICLCEGGLCLLGNGDDPLTRDILMLEAIGRTLKPGALLITTVLNAFRPARDPDGPTFDPHSQTVTEEHPAGEQLLTIRQRFYTPTEFQLMLKAAGFEVKNVWGGTAGNWRRGPMELDEYEFMCVARWTR